MQDIRYAIRGLLRSPAFTGIAVLTLALGIGANAAIFTVVDKLLLRPLPFVADTDRLAALWTVAPGGNDHNEASPGDVRDWRVSLRSFDRVVAHAWWTGTITGGDRPEQVQGFRVSPDYFIALGLSPLLGRTFAEGEDEPGRDRLVVLSYGLWQRRYGGDSSVVGRVLSINGIPRTVIGVMPRGVKYPAPAEMWAPLQMPAEAWTNRQAHYLLVTGRLAPGATLESARAEMAARANQLAAEYPETNTGWGATAYALVPDLTRMVRPMLGVLLAAVSFVLLIGCVNVANLLLARGTARRRELGIRAALGAARVRLVRQLLTESLVLALAGGAAGVLVATWGTGVLTSLVPPEHQRFLFGFDRIQVDTTVLAYTGLISFAAAMLFGLLPALRTAGGINDAIRSGAVSSGPGRYRLRRSLVAVEVALALVLLVGAGLTFRSFRHLGSVDPGFDPEGVAVTSIALPGGRYPDEVRVIAFYDDLLGRVAALPGVTAAGASNVIPQCSCNQTTSFEIAGAPRFERGRQPEVGYRVVAGDYFAAQGIPLRAGRAFTSADVAGAPAVVIVNETLARRWFEGNAVGRRMVLGADSTQSAEIVGVVGDVRHKGPAVNPDPEYYVPNAQDTRWEMVVSVRGGGDPAQLLGPVRAAVQAIDPDLALSEQRSMRSVVNLMVGPFRFALKLLGALGVIALILAGVGIYGVVSQLVGERTREIGIRIALGGDRSAVRRLVVLQGMGPAAVGLGVGLIAAFGLAGLVGNKLPGVGPRDPVTLGSVALVLLGIAALACWAPARRATRVDPISALRSE